MTDNPYSMDDWKYWLFDIIEDSKEELERAVKKIYRNMDSKLVMFYWGGRSIKLKNYFKAIDLVQKYSFPGCAVRLHSGGTTYIRTWDEDSCMFAIIDEVSSVKHISKIIPKDVDLSSIEFWHINITDRYL